MTLFSSMTDDAAPENSRVLVVAVGGCGINTVGQLLDERREGYELLSVDTDAERLAEMSTGSRVLLGEDLADGLGTGGDDLLAARCMSGKHMTLRDELSTSKVNIIVGGLGGGTATAVLPEIAKISRSLGVLTLVVASKPFRYEGSQKLSKAKRKIHSLFRSADSVFLINNETLMGEKKNFSASEALVKSDEAIVETVGGLLDFITPEKRMLLDFGTIKGQLTHGGLAAFATGVSAMRNNAIEALKAALAKFALHKSDITKAPRAVIQFSIDNDVLMDGVKNAFGVAQRVFSKNAELSLGVVFNDRKQGKTSVSIIATGLPLFNEVVDISERMNQEAPVPLHSRGASRRSMDLTKDMAAGRKRPSSKQDIRGDYTRFHILNGMRLKEEDLRIPAYLRRRQMQERD